MAMDGSRAWTKDARARPGKRVALLQLLALLAAGGLGWLTLSWDRWQLAPLLVLVAFAALSMLTPVAPDSTKLRINGAPLAVILAAVLLGGGPAAIVGLVVVLTGYPRRREALHHLRANILKFVCYPLAGGLFFHLTTRLAHTGRQSAGYYLLVLVTLLVTLALNFLIAAGHQGYLDRSSLADRVRQGLIPVLSAELFPAALTLVAVWVAVHTGTTGIAMLGLLVWIFQYLVAELLTSKHRGTELQRMATTDGLTGLGNRESFWTWLQERIADSGPGRSPFGVLLLDLDRFKEVNDGLGHHYGDELLRVLGDRLAAHIGAGGLVARLGGDEFAVIPAGGGEDPGALEAIAAELITSVSGPVALEEMTLEVGASVGIARFPLDGEEPGALLRCADIAMYAAKEAHAGSLLYAADLDRHSMRRLNVMSEFRHALDSDEIVVYYQPIVGVGDGQVHGCEGLVRWQHPTAGLLAPGAFIPTVEQTGLVGPLTRLVLARCVAECAEWRRSGLELTVSVNLSVRNLLDRSLPGDIERLLDTHGLPASALQLEITESMLMSDPDRALSTVTRLSALGVGVSVDDFGTGYSSLAYLRRFPIDELKLDRSYVSAMLSDESDLVIVRSTINLGHELGLRVIAEGVEDEPTLALLADLGCDLAQGYHFSRPVPAGAFKEWAAASVQSIALNR
jgi:diguanylate cyclase (GGDEF)-like protein